LVEQVEKLAQAMAFGPAFRIWGVKLVT